MIRGYSVRLDWSDLDDAYVATSPEFPGLTGIDEEPNAALDELREAMQMAIEVLEEDGDPLPARRPLEEYSGQFRLRVPRSLHASLAFRAAEEGVSLNTYVATELASAIGGAAIQTRLSTDLSLLLRDLRSELEAGLRPLSGLSATANVIQGKTLGSFSPFSNDLHS